MRAKDVNPIELGEDMKVMTKEELREKYGLGESSFKNILAKHRKNKNVKKSNVKLCYSPWEDYKNYNPIQPSPNGGRKKSRI